MVKYESFSGKERALQMKSPQFDPQDMLEPGRPASPRRERQKQGLWFWKALVSLLFITIAFSGVFYLYLRYSELPQSDIINTSKVVSSDGETLADLSPAGQNRIQVSLKDIPQNVIDATISVEDQQFYNHGGFDFRGLGRAMLVDLKSGAVVEGGSTITQQLAKNLFLTQDQTIKRKLREAVLTLQLEMNYSKDEILEQYLNVIYYGQGAYGIEMAAETYFHKHAKDLDLAESAMLAGVPKGPNLYNPITNLEAAKARQKVVLDAMVHTGKITQTLADEAAAEELKIMPPKSSAQAAPYFTDYVSYQLKNTYNISDEEMYRGGLSVETTLDSNMQAAAEQAVADHMKNIPAESGLEVSLIALDPQTGEIKAMVGGKNYNKSAYNRTIAKRQPGSSFKPVLYLTALNNRYTPATRVKSEPKTFDYTDRGGNEKSYEVHNFANIYANDYLTMRQGIARSDNIWAVTTVMDVGPQKVIDTAKALGITSELEPYPSLALGVFPVSPIEMVTAYATLANGGYKVEPHAIKQIKDSYTNQIQSFDPQKTSIIDAGAAYVLTDMMKSVFTDPHGTGYRVHNDLDFPIAGKSGSTDTDAWMIGYTPNLVCAVWIGYDKDQLLTPTESYLAAPIFADFMKAAHDITPAKDFEMPSNVVEEYIDPATGQLATENCPTKEKDYFLKGSEPTEWCTEHPSAQSTLKNAEQKSKSGFNAFWNWLTGKNKGK